MRPEEGAVAVVRALQEEGRHNHDGHECPTAFTHDERRRTVRKGLRLKLGDSFEDVSISFQDQQTKQRTMIIDGCTAWDLRRQLQVNILDFIFNNILRNIMGTCNPKFSTSCSI